MESNNAVRRAIKIALMTGTATAIAMSPQVYAQDDDAENIEEITVTGTRIKNRDLTAISPVKSVTQEEFKLAGVTRVEDLIGNLPQAIADFGGLVANGATGSANVDLRGLGSQRTLVLVNGRRLMPGDPTQNGNSAPDLNQIPGSLIERVEVLTGGASAVYGADAVAGVVNFIMDENFEGARLDIQQSGYSHKNSDRQIQQAVTDAGFQLPSSTVNDGNTTDITLTLGMNTADGRGNATMYIGYRDIEELLQSERDYSACALGSGDIFDTCFGSSSASPARFQQVEQIGVGMAPGAEIPVTPMTPRGPNGELIEFTGDHLFNYAPFNHYQRPDTRWTAGVFSHLDLNEHATVYGEFQFMDDRTDAQIAPSAAFRGSGPPSQNGAYTVNCDNPFLEADQLDYICTQQGLAGSDDALISIGRRLTEGGGRSNNLVHTSYRAVAGLRGDFTDNWSYDGYFMYGTTNYEATYRNDVSLTRIGSALTAVDDGQGNIVCRVNADTDVTNDDPLCVPMDIFHGPEDISAASVNYVSVPAFQNGKTTQYVVSAAVMGDLTDAGVKLPTADDGLGIAIGAEYRREESDFFNDVLFATGGLVGQGGATLDTNGSFQVKEVFTEARLPLVQGRTGFESASIEAGYRYSDYSLGFETDTWKVGADWEPVESIRFRTTLQRAVRAPNIQELFRPRVVQLDGSSDPCAVDVPGSELPSDANPNATLANCMNTGVTAAQYGNISTNPASQYNGLTGGNPNLDPESADTFSAGFVWSPSFVDGLNLTVDWYDIEIDEVIGGVGADLAVNTCLTSGDPLFCGLVNRAPGSGSLWLGQQGFVVNTNQNLGTLKATGIDTEITYGFDLPGAGGGLDINFIGSWVNELTTEPLPGFETYNCAGLFGNVCGRPTPEWRHKARVSWGASQIPLNLNLTWRHVGEVVNENTVENSNFAFEQFERTDALIDSYDYLDLAGTYVWDTDLTTLTFRVGVNNVTDEAPPILGQDVSVSVYVSGNTFPQSYDVLGRYWFVNFTAEF
jgi:iron complex outermembrane receptor protein